MLFCNDTGKVGKKFRVLLSGVERQAKSFRVQVFELQILLLSFQEKLGHYLRSL